MLTSVGLSCVSIEDWGKICTSFNKDYFHSTNNLEISEQHILRIFNKHLKLFCPVYVYIHMCLCTVNFQRHRERIIVYVKLPAYV